MFKNRLKEYRELRGFSQTKLAEMLGLSRSLISMYENGERKPSFESLEAIADILNVSFNDLMGVGEREYLYGLSPVPSTIKKPRLGRVACGEPILADENIEGYDDVPDFVECDFTLTCEGDSMIGARIYDGDTVYVRIQETVENGQIAVVRIGEETTLKRWYRNEDTLTLMPENPKYAPLVFVREQLNDIRILGRAVAFTSMIN